MAEWYKPYHCYSKGQNFTLTILKKKKRTKKNPVAIEAEKQAVELIKGLI